LPREYAGRDAAGSASGACVQHDHSVFVAAFARSQLAVVGRSLDLLEIGVVLAPLAGWMPVSGVARWRLLCLII
jgi:hypothetical protein